MKYTGLPLIEEVYLYDVVALSGEQNHVCAYCQNVMILRLDQSSASMGRHATRDHVIPRSEGGSDAWDNLVAACSFCNGLRGTVSAYWFSNFMAHLFAWTNLRVRWHQLSSDEQSRLRRLVRKRHKRYKDAQAQTYAKAQAAH